MKLLAVETATEVCGVALTEDNDLAVEYRLNRKNVHNEKLVSVIEEAVSDLDWRLSDLDGIAVGIGPGSFTGLRIGIAVGKGLGYSLDIPLVAVNTLDAIATGAKFWTGRICAALKARADEVYCALYEAELDQARRISDYQIMASDSLPDLLTPDTLVLCHPAELASLWRSKANFVRVQTHPILSPLTVAQMGYSKMVHNETRDISSVEPFYLQDFVPKRKASLG